MPSTPFGADWDALTLDHLSTFLAAAEDEGLTWEAKGKSIRSEHVIEAASAFGNSLLGGYLILGASRTKDGPWALDGWTFPGEPKTWVSTCLMSDAVRPRPSFDTVAWQVAAGRHVAVVNFRPVSVPPVITRNGQVWERLSGVSAQVRDPAAMRSLVQRGQEARESARQIANAARMEMWDTPPEGMPFSIIVSMASPAFVGDVSPTVFRKSTMTAATALLTKTTGSPFRTALGADVSQHAVTVSMRGVGGEASAIRIGRHGSIAVGRSIGEGHGLAAVVGSVDYLRPAWGAAAELMASFVGEAPAFVAVGLSDPQRGWTSFDRWTAVPGVSDADLRYVWREARRALGYDEWEPESTVDDQAAK